MIQRLAIIGVGLIGGSLALALKEAGIVREVVGYARKTHTLQQALDLNIIDRAETQISQAVSGADMIFLAVPMAAMTSVLTQIAPHLTDGMIITDGGSAKAQLIKQAKTVLGERFSQFVPGHPIAGTEKSGPAAAFASLYQNQRVVLTPTPDTDSHALGQVRHMWEATGAEVHEMEAEHHDTVLAATSHLPHVLAFNLVDMLAKREDCEDVLRYAAGGFKDFSRIASSDPVMWRDICLSNRDAILALLAQYQQGLAELEAAIRQQDGEALMTVFSRAKQARDTRFNEQELND